MFASKIITLLDFEEDNLSDPHITQAMDEKEMDFESARYSGSSEEEISKESNYLDSIISKLFRF